MRGWSRVAHIRIALPAVSRPSNRHIPAYVSCRFFFFNDPAHTELYTLSLHDALPISACRVQHNAASNVNRTGRPAAARSDGYDRRSEEHTSELQSRVDLVCRVLL